MNYYNRDKKVHFKMHQNLYFNDIYMYKRIQI